MPTIDEPRENLQRYVQREQKLRLWTWLSLLAPLALFVVLLVMANNARSTLAELNGQIVTLNAQIETKKKELAALQQTQAESNFALTAVKIASRPAGAVPRIVYYRQSESDVLKGALEQLGIKPEAIQGNYAMANPDLAGKPVDTLAYGCAVTQQDLQLIAAALIKAGVPIRRIEPAVKQHDPLLVQLIASARTDSTKAAVNPATWKKPTSDCPASGSK